jgi:hypothetical protein
LPTLIKAYYAAHDEADFTTIYSSNRTTLCAAVETAYFAPYYATLRTAINATINATILSPK